MKAHSNLGGVLSRWLLFSLLAVGRHQANGKFSQVVKASGLYAWTEISAPQLPALDLLRRMEMMCQLKAIYQIQVALKLEMDFHGALSHLVVIQPQIQMRQVAITQLIPSYQPEAESHLAITVPEIQYSYSYHQL